MQVCPKCNIKIRGDKRCCPLCQGNITGEPEDNAFKVLPARKVNTVTLFRICVFLFIIYEVVMGTIYQFSGYRFRWALFAIIWGIVGIIDIRVALYLRGNIIKLITFETFFGIIITYIIDRMTGGYAFSVTWVNPIAFVLLPVVTIIIGVSAKLRIVDYAVYLLVDVLASMSQIIPIVSGFNRFTYPAVLSMGIMVVFAAFVLIFRRRDLINATSKYLNIYRFT